MELRVMQDEYDVSRVSDRLREIVRARGESLKGFSERLEIPYRSFQDYVAGKSKPGFEQLQKMALSGVDVGYVLTGRPTINQIYNLNSHLNVSKFLSADHDLVELIIHGLPDVIDAALKETPDDRFLGSLSWPIVALWEQAAMIAAAVSDELSNSLTDLKAQSVSTHSIVQIILEATTMKLLAKVRDDEVP